MADTTLVKIAPRMWVAVGEVESVVWGRGCPAVRTRTGRIYMAQDFKPEADEPTLDQQAEAIERLVRFLADGEEESRG